MRTLVDHLQHAINWIIFKHGPKWIIFKVHQLSERMNPLLAVLNADSILIYGGKRHSSVNSDGAILDTEFCRVRRLIEDQPGIACPANQHFFTKDGRLVAIGEASFREKNR